jgi:hypothetical protein
VRLTVAQERSTTATMAAKAIVTGLHGKRLLAGARRFVALVLTSCLPDLKPKTSRLMIKRQHLKNRVSTILDTSLRGLHREPASTFAMKVDGRVKRCTNPQHFATLGLPKSNPLLSSKLLLDLLNLGNYSLIPQWGTPYERSYVGSHSLEGVRFRTARPASGSKPVAKNATPAALQAR